MRWGSSARVAGGPTLGGPAFGVAGRDADSDCLVAWLLDTVAMREKPVSSHLPWREVDPKVIESAQLRTLLAEKLTPGNCEWELHKFWNEYRRYFINVQGRGRVDPGNTLGIIRPCPSSLQISACSFVYINSL